MKVWKQEQIAIESSSSKNEDAPNLLLKRKEISKR